MTDDHMNSLNLKADSDTLILWCERCGWKEKWDGRMVRLKTVFTSAFAHWNESELT